MLFLDSETHGLQSWQKGGVCCVRQCAGCSSMCNPSSGSGQTGVSRMELSGVCGNRVCRNGSKQQYLGHVFKSSLFKTVLVLSKGMCCSTKSALSARPFWCLWWMDHAECQSGFCTADTVCCRVLQVLAFSAGYPWMQELRCDVMRYVDPRHGLSGIGLCRNWKYRDFLTAGVQFIVSIFIRE